jgi:HEAT repeat protein
MLQNALPINPFTTHPEESEPEETDISPILEASDGTRYTSEEFLDRLRRDDRPEIPRPILITGPSGSGKTFLLNQIALQIAEETESLPIEIALSPSGELSPRRYLYERWLPRASKIQPSTDADLTAEFETLLQSGRVWFFLDGVEDLTILNEYRSGWAARSRALVTCRSVPATFDPAFEVYRLLPLAYPIEAKRFISRWFPRSDRDGDHPGDRLWESLEKFGPDRLRECFDTPLRLALLCRLWQECRPALPTTRAGLYRQLVRQFYRWQAENVITTGEQQRQIDDALGKLALQSLQTAENLTKSEEAPAFQAGVSLTEPSVKATFGELSPLFPLALRLGWLTATGSNGQKTYSFLDEAFRDYFAARAIDDWRFFLPVPENGPDSGATYRIFEERWKRVILFWLGDEERGDAPKNEFLNALADFHDRCGSWHPYRTRAYFLVMAGAAEFPRHDRAVDVLRQVIHWAFQDNSLAAPVVEAARAALLESDRAAAIEPLLSLYPPSVELPKEVLKTLEKIGIGHQRAIEALSERLANAVTPAARCQLAESLGRLDIRHPLALQAPLSLLEIATDDESRSLALSCLERMAKADPRAFTEVAPPAIAAIVRLLRGGSPTLTRHAFFCLETIGRGNATAIAALVQSIRTTRDCLVHCQAAESLDRIDPGNPTAIAVLTRSLQTAETESNRQQAVYRLGEIVPGNTTAIAALIDLLATSRDDYTCWLAISSLGKIGAGNPRAIDELVRWVRTPARPLLHKESIDSLVKIAPDHPVGIDALASLVQSVDDDSIRLEAAETLGRIDPGNPVAIAALGAVLQGATDEFTRRQAAVCLGKIDPGNLEAILALVTLIRSSGDTDIRGLAIESLGEIGNDNPVALATLLRCLQQESEPKLLRLAARSLGRIGRDRREAIAALSRLGRFNTDETVRLQAFESLSTTVSPARSRELVTELAGFLGDIDPDPASQLLLWHCAARSTYEDYYRAWHATGKTEPDGTTEDDFPTLLNRLSRESAGRTRFLWIDSACLLDLEYPVVDIYDRMLAQNCRPFDHGIPETLSKLRLYWNQLCRETANTRLVWVFYENPRQSGGFSADFLASLQKFPGDICVLTRRAIDFPRTFPADDPGAFTRWIRENLSEKV